MKKLLAIMMMAMIFVAASCEKEQLPEQSKQMTLKGKELITQPVDLQKGWNMISLYVESELGNNPEIVFAEIADKIIIMKTFGLLNEVWWSPYANTVTLDCRVSYMIKVTEDCSTNIVGTLTDAEVVQLDGWSMPGYPENVPNDGTEYYFGIQEDYDIYDHGKNLNGSKIFWPYAGITATAEPGDGFKVHHTGDKKGRFPYDPQALYFDMNGKHISYADAKGMTICIYPLDQEIKMIHQDRFTK